LVQWLCGENNFALAREGVFFWAAGGVFRMMVTIPVNVYRDKVAFWNEVILEKMWHSID
jgi:hypothetical protein